MQNETLKLLSSWSSTISPLAKVEKLYIFGSLINDKGRDFHEKNSDIDLVVTFGPDADQLQARIDSTVYLATKIDELEAGLIKLLKRDAQHPHTSFVCLTGTEKYHGIHKSQDFNLLSERQFVEVKSGVSLESEQVSVTDTLDEPSFREECGDAISVIAFSQEVRNKYLSNSFNAGYSGLADYNDADPFPKKMMRIAAMAGWRALGEDKRKRTDLAVGMRYLQSVIANRSTYFEELHRKIEGRVLGRGTPAPLSRVDQLSIAEILFEEAKVQLVSRRAALDGIISKLPS
jgi:predicted nucleotidyltransferase